MQSWLGKRRCLVVLLGVAVATCAFATQPVRAETPTSASEPDARSAFEAGRQAYDHGLFGQALVHFERAYALSPRPELLFNIGRAADSDGQPARAASAYAAYLEALPNADNHDFVRARLEKVRALDKATGNQSSASSMTPDNGEAPEPSGYRELIDEALREMHDKNFEEARALFLRANALFPNARTHRGIAMTEFELRNYPACITEVEAALNSTVRPLDEKLRPDAERLLARAQTFVGRLIIETKPAASELRVDGRPLTEAERAEPSLVLKLGEHVVEALAPGYAPEKRQVSLRGGETENLTILFTRPTVEASDAVAHRQWYKSPWLWSAVGFVAAGAAIGAGLASRGGSTTTAPSYGGSIGLVLTGPHQAGP